MNLSTWFSATISTIENWAKTSIAKISTFLSPFLKDIEPYIEKDVIAIVQNGLPIVIAALAGNPVGNLPAALAAAEAYIIPALKAEGIVLYQTSVNILSNMLAARAQIVTPTVAVIAPVAAVITPIPSLQADSAINTAAVSEAAINAAGQ